MTSINFKNEPCACPVGQCAAFVEPDSKCINRLSGDVRTQKCPKHDGWTWHHDGRCLACAEGEEKRQRALELRQAGTAALRLGPQRKSMGVSLASARSGRLGRVSAQ